MLEAAIDFEDLKRVEDEATERALLHGVVELFLDREAIPRRLRLLRGLHQVRFDRTLNEVEALDNLQWGITGEAPERRLKKP